MARLRRLIVAVAVAVTSLFAVSPATPVAADGEPSFTSIQPVRLLDTRPDYETIDGSEQEIGRRTAGEVYEFQIAGRGGIPADADAAMFNVIAEQPSAPGYLTVFPCGRPPNASHVNYLAGQVVSNAAVSGLTSTGSVCVFTLADTDIVVDVTGYSLDGGVIPFTPERLLETRDVPEFRTIDRRDEAVGPLGIRDTYQLQVAGRGSVPDSAKAAFLNVTAINPDAAGFVTVYPCDESVPDASHVNYQPGQIAPNAVMAKLDGDGKICLFTLAQTDMIVDVGGYSTEGVEPLTPSRLLDTRIGEKTSDGQHAGAGRVDAGETYVLDVVGRGGLTADAAAAIINVTAVDPQANGFLTVFPCDRPRPNASSVNYFTGDLVPNAVLARISTAGTICIYSLAPTHLIVDVNGYALMRAPEFQRNSLEADAGINCGIRTSGEVTCWGGYGGVTLDGEFTDVTAKSNVVNGGTVCGINKISLALECSGDGDLPESLRDKSFTDVSMSAWTMCAIDTDGHPHCSGRNMRDNTPNDEVLTTLAVNTDFDAYACGIRTDQTAVCWGPPITGQPPADKFVALDVGRGMACGIKVDGHVLCWDERGFPWDPPHGVFKSISVGGYNACGILDDDHLHCWTEYQRLPWKTVPSTQVEVRHVAVAQYHGCAILADGRPYCWGGDNIYRGDQFLPDGPW